MIKYTLLLALAVAQEEAEEQTWIGADWALSETTKVWEWCDKDADCSGADANGNPSHICVKHMWKNTKNGEYDSGSGCAWKGSCKGTATW